MSRVLKFLLFFPGLVLLPLEARAWSTPASKTYHSVKELEMLVEEYREDHGKLPDEAQFNETLQPKGYPRFEDGHPFVDKWHRKIVYRKPGKNIAEYVIYSLGENGIDDGGTKDDISNWNGVNDGYYWKEWWPLGRFTLVSALVVATLILFCNVIRPWRKSKPVAGMIVGSGTSLGCFLLMHPGIVPGQNVPLSIGIGVGLLILVFSARNLRFVSHKKTS